MFHPQYTITDLLLANIKRITSLTDELNFMRFPRVVLVELEKTARAVSSHTSTSIEGNPLPLTEVKKILKSKPEHIRDSEREVLNYNTALLTLEKKLHAKDFHFSLELICDIHGHITQGLLPVFQTGKLRKEPVVVLDPRTGKTVYLPPDADKVERLMNDVVAFVENEKNMIDPLIIAGIVHKQMVIIHPFMDGNGRTTRLATKALLANMGLDTFNLFSFENYYNNNVTKYFQMVGEYGDYNELAGAIDFTGWLEYFTGGIIDELLRVQKILVTVKNSPEMKLQKHHEDMLIYIRTNGYITDREYAKLTDRAKATRALDFKNLIARGIIERKGKGPSTYYMIKA